MKLNIKFLTSLLEGYNNKANFSINLKGSEGFIDGDETKWTVD